MARARDVLFRIFYSTSFTVVFLVLIGLIALTPADAVYESYRNGRILDIFIVAGVYVLTALVAMLVYASRLYTNRSALKDIPKTFMPIDADDLPGRRIYPLIVEELARSAVVAYRACPRAPSVEDESATARDRIAALLTPKVAALERQRGAPVQLAAGPTWGDVSHPGWSSPVPTVADVPPNLAFETVVAELCDLVEAKAVSLAPVHEVATGTGGPRDGKGDDHDQQDGEDEDEDEDESEALGDDDHDNGATMTALPDERIIEMLRRPTGAGLREYRSRLVTLGVVDGGAADAELWTDFLRLYERGRFCAPLTETEFHDLMGLFAEMLRRMRPIDAGIVEQIIGEDDEADADEETGDRVSGTSTPSPSPSRSPSGSIASASASASASSAGGRAGDSRSISASESGSVRRTRVGPGVRAGARGRAGSASPASWA